MGGATSKVVRRLPKEKPSWSGVRTPTGFNVQGPEASRSGALASETKSEAIEADGKDPQFMAKLNTLGPVRVEHRSQVTQRANHSQAVHRSRIQLEAETTNAQVTRNRLLATAMSDFLDARKSLTTKTELESLAVQYHIDADKLQELCSHFNSPSIDESTIVRKPNESGEEAVTMMACWVDPALQHHRQP